MRVFHVSPGQVSESSELPQEAPERGFVWLSLTREEFELQLAAVQLVLQRLGGVPLLDLHISDLLNTQLPSRYDYTSDYDLLVFRRLGTRNGDAATALPSSEPAPPPQRQSGPPVLRRIDTSPVGFAVFDKLLLTVHPADCTVRDAYAQRLFTASAQESRGAGVKLPASPADLMLRVVNLMVDGYLELRRDLSRQMDRWQFELLRPRSRFSNWSAVLDARRALHQLDEVCEDQRSAIQDWIDAIETWPEGITPAQQRERDLLKVRSRDVLEHIERVVHHVSRLEHSAETAVQLHFSAQSHRTNEIMRTLTALTAVFLPLNLITGFFGMNFEFMPMIHTTDGFWWIAGLMLVLLLVILAVFWRKRYLANR